MRIQYILILIAFSACTKPPLSHFGDKDLSGQTPTSDMVFVAGKGKVPSFYVGVSEEPNVNYVAYLHWLRRVYLDYPQVAKDAEIRVKTLGEVHRFNDPLLTYHMEHPAFAYYPIVGATWYQANKYLQWKTDRVNEDILIRNKILEVDYHQMNAANYNTETYVYGQDDGLTLGKKQLRDERVKRRGTRDVSWADGILLPQYRLPTEAEWELLKIENTLNDLHTQYPYGKNYPILRWVRTHFRGSGSNSEPHAMSDYDYHWKKGVIPNPSDYENYAQGIQGPYLSKKNKLPSNIAGNVREWLLDIYEDEPQSDWETFAQYFWQNEFETRADSMQFVYDLEGRIDLKDQYGKFPFKVYGSNSDGSAMWVVPPSNDPTHIFQGYKYDTVAVNRFIYKFHSANFDGFFSENEQHFLGLYSVLHYDKVLGSEEWNAIRLKHYMPRGLDFWLDQLDYIKMQSQNRYNRWGHYGIDNLYKGLNRDSVIAEAKGYFKIKWDELLPKENMYLSAMNYQVYVKKGEQFFSIKKVAQYSYRAETRKPRLVRGGTWQSPDFNRREPMSPDSAAMDVGFRCVMPYISTPVKREYKVKW
jgi:formylglycine-generating enzyme required for sulfatase activity